MTKLARKSCTPCTASTPPLAREQVDRLLADLNRWSMASGHHLSKTFSFQDFAQALAFVNRVGELAEEQQHHPDVHLSWGQVKLDIWTHAINGLTENDFILAAKIDELK
jgi:4a-hydroxytetrahydrobiopterin dehydratase